MEFPWHGIHSVCDLGTGARKKGPERIVAGVRLNPGLRNVTRHN